MTPKDKIVSAQVILHPASGTSRGDEPVTAANIEALQPSREATAAAQSAFAEAGFEVGNAIGNSFSISAPLSKFEKFFKTHLHESRDASRSVARKESSALELPVSPLPAQLRRLVKAITFTPPPDFGPGNY